MLRTEKSRKSFEAGRSYWCRSACDHDCVWVFRVVTRTAKRMVIVEDSTNDRKLVGIRLCSWTGEETAHPMGHYSMAPVLSSAKIVEVV